MDMHYFLQYVSILVTYWLKIKFYSLQPLLSSNSTQKYSHQAARGCLVASGLQDAIRNDMDVVFRADKQPLAA